MKIAKSKRKDAKAESDSSIEQLREIARSSSDHAEALDLLGEVVTLGLIPVLEAGHVKDAAAKAELVRKTGLVNLLIEAWADGRLTRSKLDGHLDRMRQELRSRRWSIDKIKLAIVTFDQVAQGLSESGGTFRYPTRRNPTRDALLDFAYSLHE